MLFISGAQPIWPSSPPVLFSFKLLYLPLSLLLLSTFSILNLNFFRFRIIQSSLSKHLYPQCTHLLLQIYLCLVKDARSALAIRSFANVEPSRLYFMLRLILFILGAHQLLLMNLQYFQSQFRFLNESYQYPTQLNGWACIAISSLYHSVLMFLVQNMQQM